MSGWLKSIVGYLMIVSVTMQMIPNKKYEQYVKLFTGMLLLVLVLQPVLKMGAVSTFLENRILQFVQEQELLEETILKQKTEFQSQSGQMQETEAEEIVILPVEQVEVEVGD